MRNGGWMTSLSCASPNSGTTRPLSGKSGTCCSAYQARIASRSSTAAAAKLIRRLCAISGQTEALLDRSKVRLAAFFEVHQTLDDIAEKGALFAVCFIVGQRLHDRDAATAVGEQHRPARLVDLVHDLA